jgi:Tetratricopeptide repeat
VKYLLLLPVFGLLFIGSDSLGFVPHRPPPLSGGGVHPHPGPIIHPPVVHAPVVHSPVIHAPVVHSPVVHNVPTFHAPYVSHGIYVNRRTGIYRPGYAYYYPYHSGWHHGYWRGWYINPWLGGITIGWLYPPFGGAIYWNPYFIVPSAPSVVVYNYSQPIPVPDAVLIPETPTSPPPLTADEKATAAARWLDQGRKAFLVKEYEKAQQSADQAVRQSPGDTAAHEFRALVLFARGRYTDAAATIHSVLAVGPGWDWETMRGLYPETETYTVQLRALEAFSRANPQDAASRFLLAYHYLVLDARDAAIKTLQGVLSIQPKDELAAHLLQMLKQTPTSDRPTPGT